MKKLFGLILLFAIMIVASVCAADVPVEIQKLEIDDTDLCSIADCSDGNMLSLERDNSFEIKMTLDAVSDAKDVEITAFVTGYEYNDVEKISDSTHVFDAKTGVTYVKKLTLSLPVKADEDYYRLRVLVSDRNSAARTYDYKLYLDVPRHSLAIKDVIFTPGETVKAGRALLAVVRIENQGEKLEENIKVKVAIPTLGVSASDFIDEIESDETESSEELYLRIPDCAEAGDYKATVTVEYDDGYEKIAKDYMITVISNEACEVPSASTEKTVIAVGPETQNVASGKKVVFPITISNGGSSAKTYTVDVTGVDFGDVTVTPSNVVVLNAGEAKAVYVQIIADEDATGENVFNVAINSDGKTLKELPMKVSVTAAPAKPSVMKNGLEIVLVVLVVILVIIGLIIGFSKLRGKDSEEEEQKTYY